MEYVQERVTTLHDFTDPLPDTSTDRACVVIPMTERTHASRAAERILTTLERIDPARVIVALRAESETVGAVRDWLAGYDIEAEILWCNSPRVNRLLCEAGLNGSSGKGRDVWLALGVASEVEEFVVLHDADAETYTERHINRLLFPLEHGHSFVKGYYARIEGNRLYGRLFRLFYAPLVRALSARHATELIAYLSAFRYALAGEMAMTGAVARQLRLPRGWGLEVGSLCDAFCAVGFDRSVQVDLGVHKHDHRTVSGPHGLGDMSIEVGAALFQALADDGIEPDYDALRETYRAVASKLVEQYATDARFNGLEYDRTAERAQIDDYARAITPPPDDTRLPAWDDASVDPVSIRNVSHMDVTEQ